MKQAARSHGQPNRPSDAFWDAVRGRLGLEADAQIARLMGRDRAVITRARGKLTPLHGLPDEAQQRLLEEVAKTFTQADSLRTWLAKIGWLLTRAQSEWIDRHFRQQGQLRFMRLLPDAYEPRPALEAQILAHLHPRQVPAGQKLSVRSGIVLTGVRGQGKTALALGSLRAHPALEEEFPDGVYFLECHQRTPEQCLDLLAVELGLELSGLSTEQRWSILQRRVKGAALLVLLDDSDDVAMLRKFYNLLGSCVDSRLLVTTYQHFAAQELAGLRLLQLEVPDLTLPEAQRLTERMLHQPIAPAERASFERLIQHLSGHPLGLTIVVGLKDDAQSTWANLLNTIEQAPLVVLEYPDATDKEGSVRICFELVYQRLVERQPRAAKVFRALGVFAEARSTVALLCEVAELGESVETTLRQLVRYWLLTIEPLEADSQRAWHTHPLLHDFARLKLHEQPEEELAYQRRYLEALIVVLRGLQEAFRQQPVVYSQWLVVRSDTLFAVQLAIRLQEWRVLFEVINGSTTLLLLTGEADALIAGLEHLAIAEGPGAVLLRWSVAMYLGRAELARQRPDRAVAYFDGALQLSPPPQQWIQTLLALSGCYRQLGQSVDASRAVARAAVAALLDTPYTPLSRWAAVYAERAEVVALFGHTEWAMRELIRAEEAYEQVGWRLNVALTRNSRAAYLLDANRPAEALVLLEQVQQFLNASAWPLGYLETVAAYYCHAYSLQQNFVAAQAELHRWEQVLSDFAIDDWPHLYAKLWQWRGAVAEGQRQYAVALAHYQQSLALWQQVSASESTQQIVRERMAFVKACMAKAA